MDLKIYNDPDDLIHALAKGISETAKEAIADRGRFNFVLSGGNSPRKLYQLLASEYQNEIDWDKTFFFFGDERFVPEGDERRNSLMAKESLFQPLSIPASHIFKIDTTGTAEQAAWKYTDTIGRHFHDEPVNFDFILLGLGDNAHTASLFPNTDVLEATEAIVKSVFVEEVDMYRITMTAPLINQARHIAFLVFGKDKSDAVYQVLEDKSGSVNQYPARLINSNDKKVEWFLDTEAASRL